MILTVDYCGVSPRNDIRFFVDVSVPVIASDSAGISVFYSAVFTVYFSVT